MLAKTTTAQIKEEFDKLAAYIKSRINAAAAGEADDRALAIDVVLGALLAYRTRAYAAEGMPRFEAAIRAVVDSIDVEYKQ